MDETASKAACSTANGFIIESALAPRAAALPLALLTVAGRLLARQVISLRIINGQLR